MNFLKKLLKKRIKEVTRMNQETVGNPIIVDAVNDISQTDNKSNSKEAIKELIMLYYAERFKVDENKYPNYFRDEYEIGFPREILKTLENKKYIRQATAIESLRFLKLPELKNIAKSYNIKVSGKKDEICERITENLNNNEIDRYITDRYWKLTEEGKKKLDEKPYISFYLEKHEYSLANIGINIFSLSKEMENAVTGNIRDILWGKFNQLSLKFYNNGMVKGEFKDYCELHRIMALFLKEEKRYKEALFQYSKYIYYRANFEASLSALNYYNNMSSIGFKTDDCADVLYNRAVIYPFMADELISISNECDLDSVHLREFLLDAFSKEHDTGVFTATELTELTMSGLNGNNEAQREICVNVMNSAIKELKKIIKKK